MRFKAALPPIAAAFIVLFISVPAALSAAGQPSDLPREQIVIECADGQKHIFDMEIATTSAQRERGLMFRQSMPKDAGMLFLFDPPEPAAFWMKNTYIPLDILFIRADGTIAKIKEGAMPFDLMPVDSAGPVKYVIELNGGEAARRRIKAGDKIRSKERVLFSDERKK